MKSRLHLHRKITVPCLQTRRGKMACYQNCMAMAVLVFYFILLLPSSSSFICDEFTDCQALSKFKKGITSDHLRDWNEANSFCNWTGVTCHPHLQSRVTALELTNLGLQGSVSPFLSNLSLLTTLSLQGNSLHGNIPTSLGGLSQLVFLNMSGNKLEGNFPASLQGCQSLKALDLSINNLSGVIPPELGQMKNLTYFAVASNRLNGVLGQFLSNLTELTRLELADNYFTGKIPSELGALKKLEIMYLHVNYLEGAIPASISNCSALREISLIENLLTGEIPLEFGAKLQNLQKMYLSNNQLSGKIPVNLSNLSHLILLDVSLNKLEGEVPPELGKLRYLENLYLHSNDLISGDGNASLSFLTALTNCSFLQKLHLGSCLFAGSLPASVGSLSKDLYYFNLLNNHITGEIPDAIGNLSSLVRLNLYYNYLDGTIPPTLGKLVQLQGLYLGRNKLVGTIPDDLGQMAYLGVLDISENRISGSIPSSLGNLSQLRYLYLSHNNLSGSIPIGLTRASLMILLDLSFNNLQGSLPTEIGLFSNLALSLNISHNNFEREIPASIGNLISALAIDLSENKFSGAVPSSIGSCISLEYLNLSNNVLEGTIPESLKQIRSLKVLDLASNQFTGNVPLWIANGTMITYLNLSYNRLTGEVPSLGSFRNFNRSSVMGNVRLCGGSALMSLPPCEVQKQKHKRRKWFYFLLAITISCTLLSCLFVFVIVRYFCNKIAPEQVDMILLEPSSRYGSRTFTQRELEVATNGFDEANLLGRGSFGSVYKAIFDDGNTTLAVKILLDDCNQSYINLKRECQILSGIKHRNLVRMVGLSWSAEFKALVLEFISNGNLEQHLYPGGLEGGGCELTLRERMSIAIDIAHGLEYLHKDCSVQVVHCDLKPQNVLIDMDMVAHVADFGIGKLISADKPKEHNSTTGFLRGSIGYIPPEYGQGIEVSASGDVYSFGVMLLEMMTRKKPTSEMFSNGLHLRKWVNSALPNRVWDVVDSSLKQDAELKGSSDGLQKLEQCFINMIDQGLLCTEENPQRRPRISLVVQKLKSTWREMGFDTCMEKGGK